jgi:mRNA (guanine-N7-)-methyltransferase
MHYAFESQEKVITLLQNISRQLRRGGIFIGTIPSSDALIEGIKKLGPEETGWSNSVYNVEFKEHPQTSFRPPFGHEYSFYLKDAVDVPEYVVPFESFRGMAEDHNLELIYRESFHDIYTMEHDSDQFGDLYRRMVGTDEQGNSDIGKDEWEAAGLYLA